jgi:hypothetical protein
LSAILRPTEEGLAGKAVATVDGDSTTQPTSRKLLRSVFDDAEAEIELLELMEPAREMARRLKDHPFQDFEDLTTTDLIMIVARCGLVIPNLMKAERLARGEPTVRAQPPSCATGTCCTASPSTPLRSIGFSPRLLPRKVEAKSLYEDS